MPAPKRLSRRLLLICLPWLFSVAVASACQYCEMAGALRGSRFGSSPAAVEVSPYDVAATPAPAATPAALTTPPPASSVVTQVSGLKPVAWQPAPAKPGLVQPAKAAFPAHMADAGLLGLAMAGGVFFWRTRRKVSPASR